jgi:hypothetical protein
MESAIDSRHSIFMKFDSVVAAAALSVLALTAPGCARQGLEFAEIEGGIREITQWPCPDPESVGFLDSTSVVVTCHDRRGPVLFFADMRSGAVASEISVPHRLHGGGVLHLDGTEYWAVVADNIRSGSSQAIQEQGLILFRAEGGPALRIGLHLDQYEEIVGAYVNTAANCAVLRTQTGRESARTAFTAQLVLLDLDQLASGDGVPGTLNLSTGQYSSLRVASEPDRRTDHPGRHLAGPTQASCLRGSDGAMSLVYSYSRRFGEGGQSWATALQMTAFGGGRGAEPEDLSVHSASFKGIYSSEARNEIVAMIDDAHTPRFVNNRLLVIGANGQTRDIPPLSPPLGWQYFDSRLGLGLAIHAGETGPDEGLLTIVNCAGDTCRSRPSRLRIRGPVEFLGGGEGQQVVFACLLDADEGCERRSFIIDFRNEALRR